MPTDVGNSKLKEATWFLLDSLNGNTSIVKLDRSGNVMGSPGLRALVKLLLSGCKIEDNTTIYIPGKIRFLGHTELIKTQLYNTYQLVVGLKYDGVTIIERELYILLSSSHS